MSACLLASTVGRASDFVLWHWDLETHPAAHVAHCRTGARRGGREGRKARKGASNNGSIVQPGECTLLNTGMGGEGTLVCTSSVLRHVSSLSLSLSFRPRLFSLLGLLTSLYFFILVYAIRRSVFPHFFFHCAGGSLLSPSFVLLHHSCLFVKPLGGFKVGRQSPWSSTD